MNRTSTKQAATRYVDHTGRIASLTSMLRGHLTALTTAGDDFAAAEQALMIALDTGRDGGPELKTVEAAAARYAAATMLLRDLALVLDTLLLPSCR